MSAATAAFLLLRAAHVLLAAIWVGAVGFVTFFLMPSLQDAGPAGAAVMGALIRRRVSTFMASMGGTTVLTGLYLYYRFTGGFDPALSGTRAAMVFGTGGIAGIAALIVGGAVVSRTTRRIGELGAGLAAAAEGDRAAILAQMTAARRRAARATRVVLALQVIAVVLMAIGHYV